MKVVTLAQTPQRVWRIVLREIKAAPCKTLTMTPLIAFHSRTARHDRIRRIFPAADFDHRYRASAAAATIDTSTPAHAAKVSQKIVKYQDTPKGELRCDNCALFEAPSSCKTVDGTIAPQGWCAVYAKKPA